MRGTVRFHFLRSVKLSYRRQLKQFIIGIFEKEGFILQSLDYIFCSDEYLLQINKDFLKHDDYTDIITFDLSESSEIVGEVYISVERVKENAALNNQSFKDELHRVMFHGALHLCGYKDKKPSDKDLMTKMEDVYLGLYNRERST